MKFFRYIPRVNYTFINGTESTEWWITNPTTRVAIVERLKQYVTAYHNYVIRDGERPDSVAKTVYGSSDYTWLVLILNNIHSLYDWPLSHNEFNAYIVDRYGSIEAAERMWVYMTQEGFVIDATSYAELPTSRRGSIRTQYDVEQTANDAKRTIKVVPVSLVAALETELKRVFANG